MCAELYFLKGIQAFSKERGTCCCYSAFHWMPLQCCCELPAPQNHSANTRFVHLNIVPCTGVGSTVWRRRVTSIAVAPSQRQLEPVPLASCAFRNSSIPFSLCSMPQSPQRKWQRLRMLITPPPIYLPCTFTRLLNLPPEVLQRIISFIVHSPVTFQTIEERHVFTGRALQDAMDAYQLCSMHPDLIEAFTQPAAKVISQYCDEPDPSISVCTPINHAFIPLLIRASTHVLQTLVLHPSTDPECLKYLDSCVNLVSLSFRDSPSLPLHYLERCLPNLQSLCVSDIRSSTFKLISNECGQLQHLSLFSSPVISLSNGMDQYQSFVNLALPHSACMSCVFLGQFIDVFHASAWISTTTETYRENYVYL